MAALEATIRDTPTGPSVLLVGDVDGAARAALDAAYADAHAAPGSELLLDFSAVGYINSTGIALIVGLLARARAEHVRVGAFGLTPHYRGIFEITRLSDFMAIYPNEPDVEGATDA